MPDMKTLTINGVQYNIVDPNAAPASHAEDKNNPHGVTAAQAGAAPAGFGFGEQAIELSSALLKSEAELDTALETIYSEMENSKTKLIRFAGYPDNSDYNWYGFLFKSSANYGSVIMQSAYEKGSLISKAKYDGTWQPLEWLNPPMVAGVEYRTTERCNGKPVWACLTKITGLPNTAYGSYNLAATYCDNMIRYNVAYERTSDGATFLDSLDAGDIYTGSYGSPYIVFNKTQADLSGLTAYVTLFYTKTTD